MKTPLWASAKLDVEWDPASQVGTSSTPGNRDNIINLGRRTGNPLRAQSRPRTGNSREDQTVFPAFPDGARNPLVIPLGEASNSDRRLAKNEGVGTFTSVLPSSSTPRIDGQRINPTPNAHVSVNPNSYKDGITRLVTSHLFDQAKKHDCLMFIRTTGAYAAITYERGVGAGKPLSVKSKSSTATFTPGSIVFLARLAKWVESNKPKDLDAALKEQIDLLAATGDPAHGARPEETRGQFAWMPKLHSLASLKRLPSLANYKDGEDRFVTVDELRYSEKKGKAVPTPIHYRVKKVSQTDQLNSYTPRDARNRNGEWDTLARRTYPMSSASTSDQKSGEDLYQIFIHEDSLQQDERLKELWEAKEAEPTTWPQLGTLDNGRGSAYLKLATRARTYLYTKDSDGYIPIYVLGEIMLEDGQSSIKEIVADYDMLAVCPSIDSLREALLKDGEETSAFARLKYFLPAYDHDQGILSAKEKEIIDSFDSEFGADGKRRSALSTRHGCEVNNLFFTVDLDFPKLMLIRPFNLQPPKMAVIVDKLLYWFALAQYQSDEAGAGREKQVRTDLGRGKAFRLSELFVFPINLAWGCYTIGAAKSDFSDQIGSCLRPEVTGGVNLLELSLSQQFQRILTRKQKADALATGGRSFTNVIKRAVKSKDSNHENTGRLAWRMAVRLLFLRCHFEAVKCSVAKGFLLDSAPDKVAWRATEEAKKKEIHPAYHGYKVWADRAIAVVEKFFRPLDELMDDLQSSLEKSRDDAAPARTSTRKIPNARSEIQNESPDKLAMLCQDLPKLREYMKPVIRNDAEAIRKSFGPTAEWPKCPQVNHAA